ncbi:MAG: glutamate ligase domain-containing protein, partial [Flavobacteriales bacterium]
NTFSEFINDKIEKNGILVYFAEDDELNNICSRSTKEIEYISYSTPNYHIKNKRVVINADPGEKEVQIFGKHNLQNLEGARKVCNQLGVDNERFFKAIKDFKGASRRLEHIAKGKNCDVFRDFAHAPSKLKASIEAVKEQYPERELIACIELHTYSSLTPEFLKEYKGSMNKTDISIAYLNPHAIKLKNLSPISEEQLRDAFNNNELKIYNDSKRLFQDLSAYSFHNKVFLLMSSGNFDGVDIENEFLINFRE